MQERFLSEGSYCKYAGQAAGIAAKRRQKVLTGMCEYSPGNPESCIEH